MWWPKQVLSLLACIVLVCCHAGCCVECVTLSTKSSPDCVYVSVNGTAAGTGTRQDPYDTIQHAVSSKAFQQLHCIYLRSFSTLKGQNATRYSLNATVSLPSNTILATCPEDLGLGMQPAVVDGAISIPPHLWSREGNDTIVADITDLLQERCPSLSLSHLFDLYVDGVRIPRVRSPLMQWAGMLDPHNSTAAINHWGFVYDAATLPSAWLSSSQQWLITAFHQWATDVHSVRQVDTSNHSILVNEPVYWKYAFDLNPYGNKRFYIENVAEIDLQPEHWRVSRTSGQDSPDRARTVHDSKSNQPPRESAHRVSHSERVMLSYRFPAASPMNMPEVLLPVLSTLFEIDNSDNVTIANVTLQATRWVLPPPSSPSSSPRWRASMGVGGSGPLPEQTAAVQVTNSSHVTLHGTVFRNMGAHAVMAETCAHLTVSSCLFDDLGASALHALTLVRFTLQDSIFSNVGQRWRQGVALNCVQCKNSTAWYNRLANLSSDGYILGGFETTGFEVAYTDFAGTRQAFGDADLFNESISDFGAVHTAIANASQQAVWMHHNIMRSMVSYRLGGFGVYLDYGTCGVRVENNIVYDVGSSPIFMNSNEDVIPPPSARRLQISNNVFVFRHVAATDNDGVLKIRALGPVNFTNNVVFSQATNLSPCPQLFVVNSDIPQQFSHFDWDRNVYFDALSPNCTFSNTWPEGQTWQEWQTKAKHDENSLITNPLFVNVSSNDFRLRANSPAIQLGFLPLNLTLDVVGPRPGSLPAWIPSGL